MLEEIQKYQRNLYNCIERTPSERLLRQEYLYLKTGHWTSKKEIITTIYNSKRPMNWEKKKKTTTTTTTKTYEKGN
jgi:hypothetical protein